MTTEEFISGVRRMVLKGNRETYLGFLGHGVRKPDVKNLWQDIYRCWDSLSKSQRDAMLGFLKLAMSETLSGLFSLLDGSSGIEGYPESFELTYGPAHDKLDCLLDYFLAAEEDDPEGG